MTSPDIDSRYYNRHKELGMVSALLGEPHERGRLIFARIINFYGVNGSGKSWLLRRVYLEYQDSTSTLLIAPEPTTLAAITPEAFLSAFIADLVECLGLELPAAGRGALEDLVADLEVTLRRHQIASPGRGLLLLVDNYDQLPPQITDLFERTILSMVIGLGRNLVIITSGQAVDYKAGADALRLQTHPHELDCFSEEDVTKRYSEFAELVPRVLQISAGLPLCVERIMEQVRQERYSSERDLLSNEISLVKTTYEVLVRQQVFSDIDPEMQDRILILAIPRRFDVVVVKDVLNAVQPAEYSGRRLSDFIDIIGEFTTRSRQIVEWNREQRAYSVKKSIRRILHYYMMVVDQGMLQDTNARLIEMYRQRISSSRPAICEDVVEYLYHTLVNLQIEARAIMSLAEATSERFSEEVCARFDALRAANYDVNEIDTLRNMVETDEDLRSHLTSKTRDYIRDLIRQSAEGPANTSAGGLEK